MDTPLFCLFYVKLCVRFSVATSTAINLFVRDLPRLSVDIDLTYLPVEDRETSLANIDAAMRRIARKIEEGIPVSRTQIVPLRQECAVTKVFVSASGVQIKIEVTPVTRGCVYPARRLAVQEQVEDEFGYAEIAVASFQDLCAGKIVAAPDRQHPRDLFDVRELLANEGIDDLYSAREELVGRIVGDMPDTHRHFLLSFKSGDPDWAMLKLPSVDALPAVRWKIENLSRLSKTKRTALLENLRKALEL